VKQASKSAAILTGLLVVVAWVIVLAVSVPQAQSIGPQPNGDYGFFTAVAERLVAGDRLYVDIWDNKDPFVFYSIAVARSAGIWGAWALELLWVLTAALAAWAISGWAQLTGHLRALVAWVAIPLILVGLPYFMGSTHLPGIALTLAGYAAALRSRFVLAGLLVAAVAFFKLIMIPLAVALIVVVIVLAASTPTMTKRRAITRFTLAAVAGSLATFVLMAARGELVPYLNAQVANVLYSQVPIVPQPDPSPLRTIIQHLVVLANPHVVAIGLASLLLLAWSWWATIKSPPERDHQDLVLWWSALTALVMSGLTIVAVAKWLHHALILAVPSALIVILVARMLQRSARGTGIVGVASLAALTFVLAGIPNLGVYTTAVRNLDLSVETAQQEDPLTTILKDEQAGSFAVIGYGNLVPRSFELTDRELACRHLAQRHFDPPRAFDETLDCLPNADIIVFAPDALERDGFPEFNEFLVDAGQFAEDNTTCREERGFAICVTSAS